MMAYHLSGKSVGDEPQFTLTEYKKELVDGDPTRMKIFIHLPDEFCHRVANGGSYEWFTKTPALPFAHQQLT